jgi:hypothetical protein
VLGSLSLFLLCRTQLFQLSHTRAGTTNMAPLAFPPLLQHNRRARAGCSLALEFSAWFTNPSWAQQWL